jgi:hypothetical protein
MLSSFLFKVLTRTYYQQNTGFFLVLVIGGFGFLRGEDHVALARLGLESPGFLVLFFFSFWTLYTLKAFQFVLKSFTDPRQEFLYLLRLLPLREQVKHLLIIQYGILQPILAYGAFVVYQGWKAGAWMPILEIAGFFLLLHLVPVAGYIRALRRPNAGQNHRTLGSYLNLNFTKPYPLFFVQYLLEDQKMLLFLGKLLSCFFVVGVCRLYPTDSYDERLLSIGLLLAGMSHVTLTQQAHLFEHRFLLFTRNLPLSGTLRFGMTALTYSILLLPEGLLLVGNLPSDVGFGYLPGGFLFLLGIVLASHQYQYLNPGNPDRAGKVYAAGFFLTLLSIMFSIPVVVPGIVFVLAAALLFVRYFPKVEYPVEE